MLTTSFGHSIRRNQYCINQRSHLGSAVSFVLNQQQKYNIRDKKISGADNQISMAFMTGLISVALPSISISLSSRIIFFHRAVYLEPESTLLASVCYYFERFCVKHDLCTPQASGDAILILLAWCDRSRQPTQRLVFNTWLRFLRRKNSQVLLHDGGFLRGNDFWRTWVYINYEMTDLRVHPVKTLWLLANLKMPI